MGIWASDARLSAITAQKSIDQGLSDFTAGTPQSGYSYANSPLRKNIQLAFAMLLHNDSHCTARRLVVHFLHRSSEDYLTMGIEKPPWTLCKPSS